MNEDLQNIKQRFHIIGNNAQLNRAIEVALQVAKTDLSVLVTGESGVGKEFFPQIIHYYSARKSENYFAINCGAIPEGTIDSELFGHEKGAFTDARAERKGYFEIANGGTLFLDEVGELPLQTQVRLLRVLETGEFIRMGSSQIQKTNVRVVAATNLDIPQAIRNGKFREDLYYRLNTVEIKVPALRERKEDIPLLFRKFALDFSDKYRMPAVRLSEDAVAMLQAHYWQGNVRQLKNVAEQLSILETNHNITASTLQRHLPANEISTALALGNGQQSVSEEHFMNERELLYKVLFDMKRDIAELRAQIQQNAHPDSMRQPMADLHTSTIAEVPKRHDTSEYQMAEEVHEEVLSVQEAEKETIRRALERNKGNRKATAQSIHMPERTLYRKIKEYGL